MSRVLAKVRLPLTMTERLEILGILAHRHGDVVWRIAPRRVGKWFIVEKRRP